MALLHYAILRSRAWFQSAVREAAGEGKTLAACRHRSLVAGPVLGRAACRSRPAGPAELIEQRLSGHPDDILDERATGMQHGVLQPVAFLNGLLREVVPQFPQRLPQIRRFCLASA